MQENQMQMPDDFYDLIEFCKYLNSEDPKSKLKFIVRKVNLLILN